MQPLSVSGDMVISLCLPMNYTTHTKKCSRDLRCAENRKQVLHSTLIRDDFSKPLTGDEESRRNIWNMQIGIIREYRQSCSEIYSPVHSGISRDKENVLEIYEL